MTTMPSLFLWCGPFAVGGFVIAIVVYSMNAVPSGRSTAHIAKEVQVGIKPTLADFDSATSVVRIFKVFPVATPIFDVCPTSIFRCADSIISFAMNAITKVRNRNSFAMKASARLALSFDKHSGFDRFFITALATAYPSSASGWSVGIQSNYSPSSKHASCEFL